MLTTGTCTGHNELLMALRDWLVNTVGWTEMFADVPSPVSNASRPEYVLRAPGALSGHEYYLWMKTNLDAGAGSYGIEMKAMSDYDSDLSISSQDLVSPSVWLNLWQNSITYWFYANNRRVIVVAKVNTSYVSAYMGLFRPFALPTEYPKAFYLGGNYPILAPYSVANARNRFVADPGDATAYYLNRNQNDWVAVQNNADSVSAFAQYRDPEAIVWPSKSLTSLSVPTSATDYDFTSAFFQRLRPGLDGVSGLWLCHIISMTDTAMIGALEGLYRISGFNMSSEQVVSQGSPAVDYRAFQNVFRTTNRDFMAIEEV